MADPIYLYGYGRRRHILAGELANDWRGRPRDHGKALCGTWGDTEKAKREEQRYWSLSDAVADRRVAKMRQFAVCKPCQKAWDKKQQET